MEPLLKSDIFFFITSIFVVVLTALLVIGGVYLVRILKNLSEASKTVKDAVNETNADLREVREKIKAFNPINLIFGRKKKASKKQEK
jgi:Sec-independent protein translocase protein TatA